MSGEAPETGRFSFGRNWLRYLELVDDERVREAESSLREMLEVRDLDGKRFLDIGCGSGLFSLAAHRLGASVHSFDYDPDSVACAEELRRRFSTAEPNWRIERGSALDGEYLVGLGRYDVVYSWGVLHHTGQMWKALDNAAIPVGRGGTLFISIYNDQGWKSRAWRWVKRVYCSGALGRLAILAVFLPYLVLRPGLLDLLKGRNPLTRHREYVRNRGMSPVRDRIDWLGGYPFEVATPEEIFDFYKVRGFRLQRLKTCGGGLGCNEYVLLRDTLSGLSRGALESAKPAWRGENPGCESQRIGTAGPRRERPERRRSRGDV